MAIYHKQSVPGHNLGNIDDIMPPWMKIMTSHDNISFWMRIGGGS
jgi:hypothetical protein